MCGIAGIISLTEAPVADAAERLARMMAAIRHRGPDSEGTFISPDARVGIVNTRLAIVDPHNSFAVPFVSPDGQHVLTYNGEIYNYRELRERLQHRGVHFRTRSDTEVLFEGLRVEGPDFLHRLDGFWSFAFYDAAANRVQLSRDIMGERHLFYVEDDGEFLFASEVEPLLAAMRTCPRIDPAMLVASFAFRTAPPGRTLLDGVHRLLPGRSAIVTLGESVQITRYTRLRPEKWFEFFSGDPGEDEVLDVYEDVVHRACRSRIAHEVPFVSTLSGGVDSSLVVAFGSDLGAQRIRTIHGQSHLHPPKRGVDDLDEVEATKFTSETFGTDHKFFRMFEQDSASVLSELSASSYDGLFDEGTASFELLARQVRASGAKVMLVSDGPDELCGGYRVDTRQYRFHCMAHDHPRRFHALELLNHSIWGRRILSYVRPKDYSIAETFRPDGMQFEPIHQAMSAPTLRGMFEADLVDLAGDAYGTHDAETYADILPSLDFSQRVALSYAEKSLPDMFNLRTDKGIMRPSVECRVPLQAPELVELMIATPAKWRYGTSLKATRTDLEFGMTKYILRKLVERKIGSQIAFRNKYGFSLPLWRHPEVQRDLRMREVIADSSAFDALGFQPNVRSRALQVNTHLSENLPARGKLMWFVFSIAMTYERLQQRAAAK